MCFYGETLKNPTHHGVFALQARHCLRALAHAVPLLLGRQQLLPQQRGPLLQILHACTRQRVGMGFGNNERAKGAAGVPGGTRPAHRKTHTARAWGVGRLVRGGLLGSDRSACAGASVRGRQQIVPQPRGPLLQPCSRARGSGWARGWQQLLHACTRATVGVEGGGRGACARAVQTAEAQGAGRSGEVGVVRGRDKGPLLLLACTRTHSSGWEVGGAGRHATAARMHAAVVGGARGAGRHATARSWPRLWPQRGAGWPCGVRGRRPQIEHTRIRGKRYKGQRV